MNDFNLLIAILRIILIIIFLQYYSNAVVLSGVDLFLTIMFLLIDILYVTVILKVRIVRTPTSRILLKEIILFGSTIFLQAFVNQANSNVDKFLLGALSSAEVVAVYSVAMQIFAIYNVNVDS